jgi:hypothetical protein
MRVQMGPKDRARIYCAGRAEGLGCKNRSTFLDVYGAQIGWYLDNFVIPKDYRAKILEAHRRIESAYSETGKQKEILQNNLKRVKELYKWGHIGRDEYLYVNLLRFLRPKPTISEQGVTAGPRWLTWEGMASFGYPMSVTLKILDATPGVGLSHSNFLSQSSYDS